MAGKRLPTDHSWVRFRRAFHWQPTTPVFAVLAYFDESFPADMGSITIGGVLCKDADWEWVTIDWQVALGKHKVEEFHASEFFARQGPFKGWSAQQSEDCLRDLLQALDSRLLSVIGIRVPIDPRRSGKQRAYESALLRAMQEALTVALENPPERLDVIVAESTYVPQARAFQIWETQIQAVAAKGQVGSSRPAWNESLQVADLFTNRLGAWNGNAGTMDPVLAKLRQKYPFVIRF